MDTLSLISLIAGILSIPVLSIAIYRYFTERYSLGLEFLQNSFFAPDFREETTHIVLELFIKNRGYRARSVRHFYLNTLSQKGLSPEKGSIRIPASGAEGSLINHGVCPANQNMADQKVYLSAKEHAEGFLHFIAETRHTKGMLIVTLKVIDADDRVSTASHALSRLPAS